jgi:uracil-DNA glycosylase
LGEIVVVPTNGELANFDLMRSIEERYRGATGLSDRRFYSIFYGPLRRHPLLMINANPGGTPDNFKIVEVMAGQHEYVEGRQSGPTTRNGAEILQALLESESSETVRQAQVLNRYFRRTAQQPSSELRRQHMDEARPFLAELIQYISPSVLVFGGDSGLHEFADVHRAHIEEVPGSTILGPNGATAATYLREYVLDLPYYQRVVAFGIYHPSKMNSFFRQQVLPRLVERVLPMITAAE